MSAVPWRLLHTPFADGPTNMAVDEAILLAVAAGQVPPTLRFFGWEPPCLSLGYAQPVAEVDETRLATLGWGLVRRPTGGRAILHVDELTYSVAAPLAEPSMQGGVLDSYRQLSQGLLRGLEILGLAAVQAKPLHARRDRRGAVEAVCFEVPSHYEITVGSKKLLGSAQMRKQGAVLQHGALPLTGDITRICEVLRFETEEDREYAKIRVRQRAITVAAALGHAIGWTAAAQALAQGLSEKLDIVFERGELTAAEQAGAAQLHAAKYATRAWNSRMSPD